MNTVWKQISYGMNGYQRWNFFFCLNFFHYFPQELISPTFYKCICTNILAPIKSLTFTASSKKLHAKLSYDKAARKMLVKLTPEQKKKKTREANSLHEIWEKLATLFSKTNLQSSTSSIFFAAAKKKRWRQKMHHWYFVALLIYV
jgi:hypothetical protein